MALFTSSTIEGSVLEYYRKIPGSLLTDVINRYRREYNYFNTVVKVNYEAVVVEYNK